MSRIPAPHSKGKLQDENNLHIFKQPSVAIKRSLESQTTTAGKKPKITAGSLRGNAVQQKARSTAISRNAGFSEKAKRAALQPISESALVRGSMPAMSISTAKTGPKVKRPAWDLKGRVQDMEEHFAVAKKQIAELQAINANLNNDVEVKSTLSDKATSQASKLEKQLNEKIEEFTEMKKEKDSEISKLKKENDYLNGELLSLKSNFDNLQNAYTEETSALKSSITQLTCSKSGLQAQLNATEMIMDNLRLENTQLTKIKAELETKCESLNRRVNDLESRLLEEEAVRRELHNTVQELKGNIRVYCRIRPALPEELKNGINLANITIPTRKSIEVHQSSDVSLNESGKAQKKYEFSFDSVFAPDTSQKVIFEEISQLIQSSIDGYNVCIFAYGQTGSGKTYTMEGPENAKDILSPENEQHLGMIPRSVQQIFKRIADLEPKGWTYKVEALFLEIYNERIQDLLNSCSQSSSTKCEIIKTAAKGNDCQLSNVVPTPVTCAEEVFQLLKKARINRAVAATNCNKYSSRSHYIFQMKISGENSMTGEKCEGILNLIDLAGSERVKESGSAGDRFTEAKSINKSLSNLGKVIMSLAKKENHVPFRDSKLTHLLANSLGGNSKTLMFVNIGPDQQNLNETINSLRFATSVNQCNIGTAQKRVK